MKNMVPESSTAENGKFIDYISLASVISSIAVVYLHANACYWTFSNDQPYWRSANVIEGLFFFAVPVFMMISGATLIDYGKRYGLREYFRRRIRKTVIPYLFWSLAGLLFQMYVVGGIDREEVSAVFILNGLLTGRLVYIYGFFISLFAAYMTIPLFAAVPEEKRKELFTFIASASFVFNSLIPTLIRCSGYDIAYSFSVAAGSGYLLFVLLGYLLSHYSISRRWRILIYAAGLAGLILKIAGTFHWSMAAGYIIDYFEEYTCAPGVLYGCAVFVFFRYEGSRLMHSGKIAALIRHLSGYTLSYYLLHWFVLRLFVEYLPMTIFDGIYRFFMPIPAILIMTLFTAAVRKVPVLRRVLP